ncbi:hypothetical protein BJQ89_01709 [Arthrobacter sp. ES1]|nr:hypothetical protein [Arthrobacter sp. ES1]
MHSGATHGTVEQRRDLGSTGLRFQQVKDSGAQRRQHNAGVRLSRQEYRHFGAFYVERRRERQRQLQRHARAKDQNLEISGAFQLAPNVGRAPRKPAALPAVDVPLQGPRGGCPDPARQARIIGHDDVTAHL